MHSDSCKAGRNVFRRPRGRLWFALAVCALLVACGEQRFQAREAPDFKLPSLDGSGDINLHQYRGDVVYLSFWASWCEPCRQEMPYLVRLWQAERERGFQVIGVNVDEDVEAARRFAEQYQLPFPLARDGDKAVSKRYRVPGFPTHYLLDRRGRIRFSAVGFNEDDMVAVGREVETLLRESGGESRRAETY